MSLNAHRLFTGPNDRPSYLAALTLPRERLDALREARDLCREAIRDGLRNWSGVARKSELFETAIQNLAPGSLRPKFKMQGSFAYATLNEPAKAPPQEIDLDDGVFVPVSFLAENGRIHPAIISSGYFLAVERALAPICDRHGWTLLTDKPSCVRVDLGGDAHIDFALYAIPDQDFDRLLEAEAARKTASAQDRTGLWDETELSEGLYRGLREDQIMLAHRDEGWKPSDPRKLEDWFRRSLNTHGEQLRRVCRYLKGWRDHQWDACRLSSIAIMACVVAAYEEIAHALSADRDDLALALVSDQMASLLRRPIENPVVPGQYLDEGWSAEERGSFASQAAGLRDRVHGAIDGTDNPARALGELQRAFGRRIPDDASLIKSDDPQIAAPAVLTSGLLKQMGEAPAPQKAVKREGDRRYG